MMTQQARAWWLERNDGRRRRSPWLHSTLAGLEEKTKAMLDLMGEDADSFAQRAEMYYERRPQLISMIEDFYGSYCSLAEKYDRVKSDSSSRLITTLGSPFSITKIQSENSVCTSDRHSDSYSEICDPEELSVSDIDDPEFANETQVTEEEVLHGVENEEVSGLREEIERLKLENKIQKDRLVQKDEQKREVIRQLSLAVEVLKEENVNLKTCIAKNSPKKWNLLELNKLKWGFWRNY